MYMWMVFMMICGYWCIYLCVYVYNSVVHLSYWCIYAYMLYTCRQWYICYVEVDVLCRY